jgi:hypothetical protein
MTLAHFIPLHAISLVALFPRYGDSGRLVIRWAINDGARVAALAASGGIEPGRVSRSVRRRASYNRTVGAGAAGDTSSSLSRFAADTRESHPRHGTSPDKAIVTFCTTRREVLQDAFLRVVVLCDKPTNLSRTIDNLAWHVRCFVARPCCAVTLAVRR